MAFEHLAAGKHKFGEELLQALRDYRVVQKSDNPVLILR